MHDERTHTNNHARTATRRLLAAGSVLLLVLAGCGGDDGADADAATGTTGSDDGAPTATDTAEDMTTSDGATSTSDDTETAAGGEVRDVSLRFNINPYGLHAPFVYAQAEGFYEEEGLNVSFGEGTGSETTGALVADGSDTFGLVDLPGMTSLVEQGAAIQSVGIVEQRSPLAVISLADSGINEPEDLVGKAVVMEGGDEENFIAFTDSVGVDSGEIDILTMEDTGQSAALESGRVDGIFGWVTSQGSETIELSGGITEMLFADFGYDLINTTIAAAESTIADDPELVCSFVRASFRGWEAANEDPQAAVDALVDEFQNVNPDIALYGLEKQLELLQAESMEGEPLGYVSMDLLDSSLEKFREAGSIGEDLAPEDIYNPMCFEG